MDNKFNNWVWKINGILILLAGLGIILAVVFTIYDTMQRRGGYKQEVINIADDPKGIEKWTLGRGTKIRGTDTLMLSLISENEEVKATTLNMFGNSSAYNMGRAISDPAKNILFVNMKNNQSSWLFESTSQLILGSEQFPFGYYRELEQEQDSEMIFYQVVTKDTNNDGVLNHKDSLSLAITAADGTGYKVVIEEFDRIISKNMNGNKQVLVVYQNKGTGYSMLFDISPYKIISLNKLPKI